MSSGSKVLMIYHTPQVAARLRGFDRIYPSGAVQMALEGWLD